jgi:hypothetical protein
MQLEDVQLAGWQDDVFRAVLEHEDERSAEQYQGAPEWNVNKELAITVAMPSKQGHTFLANFIAAKQDAILVYRDIKHLKAVTGNFALAPGSQTVSMYEIFYALFKPDVQQPSPELAEMTKRIRTAKPVIVDEAGRVPQQVKDFILANAQGPIVFLGR